ncbi:MAG: PilZ domain-containing protein [Vicinamibacterales bacterium]
MSITSDILVVSADPTLLQARVTALRRAGFSARAAASFPDARRALEDGPPPEVLVTDVRLGPYNGLHLVAVARVEFPRTVAIVVGGRDHVLEVEAAGLGARYLLAPVTPRDLELTIAELLAVPRPKRRWPRKRLAGEVAALVGGLPGRLLDVSYGGACLEVFGAAPPGEDVHVVIPELGLDLTAQRVWAHRADPLQPVACGVAFTMADTTRWHTYVDQVAMA